MQPDRRLVEHVTHADKAAADLCREPDALRLAAGERGTDALERQVPDSHVHHEREALADLLEDGLGDALFLSAEGQRVEEAERVGDGQSRDLVDRSIAHADRERLAPQPRALAGRARQLAHVFVKAMLDVLARGLAEPPGAVRNHPLELDRVAFAAACVGAVEQHVALLRG